MILGDCCDTDVSSVKKLNPAELKILQTDIYHGWVCIFLLTKQEVVTPYTWRNQNQNANKLS